MCGFGVEGGILAIRLEVCMLLVRGIEFHLPCPFVVAGACIESHTEGCGDLPVVEYEETLRLSPRPS